MAPPKQTPTETEASLAWNIGVATRGSRRRGDASGMTNEDNPDIGRVEEVEGALRTHPPPTTLLAVPEGEELNEDALLETHQGAPTILDVTSRRSDELIANLRALVNAELPNFGALRALFEIPQSNAAETSTAPHIRS